MASFVSILTALIILGVLITIHEFGHFVVGRWCGIGVIEFSVGMGPKIIGTEKNGTKYSLRAIPLGGYCSFVGENESSSDTRAMNNQPVWKRFLTVVAGPLMNLLLAFVLAVVLISTGAIPNPYVVETVPAVYDVAAGTPAAKAGLMKADAIVSVNGVQIAQNDQGVALLTEMIKGAEEGEALVFTVKRNGEALDMEITPEYSAENGRKMIGITFAGMYQAYDANVLTAIPEACTLLGKTIVNTIVFLKEMLIDLVGGRGVQDGAVTGVVGIVAGVSSGIRESFQVSFLMGVYTIIFWMFNISLSLGIMNLLPIPALDGGRILFLIVEKIRRKPVNREKEALVNLIGFGLLILLMIVITVSDVRSLLR